VDFVGEGKDLQKRRSSARLTGAVERRRVGQKMDEGVVGGGGKRGKSR
jgi:hypothetical protein